MPEIQLFEVWLFVPRDMSAYGSKRTENNSKVNFVHVAVQVTMPSEGTELDDSNVLARGVTRET